LRSLVLFYHDAWISLKTSFLVFFVSLFIFSCHNNIYLRNSTPKDPTVAQPIYDPETGDLIRIEDIKFDPETGESLTQANVSSGLKKNKPVELIDEYMFYDEDTLTQKQIVALAQKNAQRKHIGALWGALGYTTSIPSGFFGGFSGALLFMGFGDEALFLPGFIGGGVVGLMAPSLLAKETSRITSINYPPNLSSIEEKEVYKKNYKSETGSLRKKSTVKGTYCSFFSFAGFMFLLIMS